MVIWHTVQADQHNTIGGLSERNRIRAVVEALIALHNRLAGTPATRDHALIEAPRWERPQIRGRFATNSELVAEVFALRRCGVGWHDIARSTGATYNQVWRIYNYGKRP